MVINVQQGNYAQFAVQFLDTTGNITSPTGAQIQVSYTNTSNAVQTDTIPLNAVPAGSAAVFIGTWSTGLASLGLATWTTTSLPSSVQGASDQIRVIQRDGGG